MTYRERPNPLTGKGDRHVTASTLSAMGITKARIGNVQDKAGNIEPPILQLNEFVDVLALNVGKKIDERSKNLSTFPKQQRVALLKFFDVVRNKIHYNTIKNRRDVFDYYDTYYSSSKLSISGRFIMIDAFTKSLGEETYKRWRDDNYDKLKKGFTGSLESVLGR